MADRLCFNEELPGEIRDALVSAAEAQDVRVNDVAGAALASRYGMKWTPRGTYRIENARIDKIWVPERLHRRLRAESVKTDGGTMRGIVLSVLAEHLGVDGVEISMTRRPRKEPS
jgi:hypothetical protein